MRYTLPLLLLCPLTVSAAEPDLAKILAQPLVGLRQPIHEAVEFCEARIQRMPTVQTAAEWQKLADQMRADVLAKVVFRGEAAQWRDAKPRIEYLETIAGGPGYKIKKLRYEAVPGLFIPALLYEPENLKGRVPAILNVNGHDGVGKAAKYKQIRCINLAKRGMLALNVEWVGMGQLRGPGFSHASLNQLDLCGTAGIAVHFLAQQRGLDVLLAHPNADPKRTAVTGVSGGGWQSIFFSSLDPRVTLSNPVAGYSSFFTRSRHPKDLGDSEQTPSDLATVADYAHLTAMMAPRPTLLTFNAADQCCFEAGYALPPLLRAAEPIFQLFQQPQAIRSHINHVPGNHNYEQDNREAFYRMVGDFFYPNEKTYSWKEIPSDAEVRSPAELDIPLPEKNQNFNSLALSIASKLPRAGTPPTDAEARQKWQTEKQTQLRAVLHLHEYPVQADPAGAEVIGDLTVANWRLRLGRDWTIPAVELSRGSPTKSIIVLADGGRKAAQTEVTRLLADGYRVLTLDPLLLGESDPIFPAGEQREPTFKSSWLYALLMGAVGERPLGIQVSQVLAVAHWLKAERGGPSVSLATIGPRTGLVGMAAAAAVPEAFAGLDLTDPLGSLKQVIEEDRPYAQTPEVFGFGLLEVADVPQLLTLTANKRVTVRSASERFQKETVTLNTIYKQSGGVLDLIKK
ncbi:MAG: hypothetical protein LC104_02795 [Bacteroidales bacterium]|nr:hypothetical protein [Bacteroidales bacterium]